MIKKLWRRVFPVQIKYVEVYQDPSVAQSVNETTLYKSLLDSQQKCPEIYLHMVNWLQKIIEEFQNIPEINGKNDQIAYAMRQNALASQISLLRVLISTPSRAKTALERIKRREIDKNSAKTQLLYTNWGD